MADPLRELEPRTPVQLYDAAIHWVVHGRSPLSAVGLLGAAPVTLAVLALLQASARNHPLDVPLLLAVLGWVFRTLCQGAGAWMGLRELEGRPVGALEAFRRALGRLPSLVMQAGWTAVLDGPLFLFTAGLTMPLFGHVAPATALVVAGEQHFFQATGEARRRLSGKGSGAGQVTLLHGAAWLMLAVNLHAALHLGLLIARTFLGVETTFLAHLASFTHGAYLMGLVVVSGALLDPLRCATSALLLADARVRKEGLDLLAALRNLQAPAGEALRGLLVLATLLLPSLALAADDDDGEDDVDWNASAQALAGEEGVVRPLPERLQGLVGELGASGPAVREALDGVEALGPAEQAQLELLCERLELDGEKGVGKLARRRRLEAALEEVAAFRAAPKHQNAARANPHGKAVEILSRPEFEAVQKVDAAEKKEAIDEPGLLARLWERFKKWWEAWWRENRREDPPEKPKAPTQGIDADLSQFATVVVGTLAALAIAFGAVKWLRLQREAAARGGMPGESTATPEETGIPDALSRSSEAWAREADALAAQGRHREAMRALYLALLARLHGRGAIDYDRTRSNWDYCREFRGEEPQRAPFIELTRRFDFGWYGRLGADGPGYAQFRTLSGPFLAEQEGGGAAHA